MLALESFTMSLQNYGMDMADGLLSEQQQATFLITRMVSRFSHPISLFFIATTI
jgi:hypothetical protein